MPSNKNDIKNFDKTLRILSKRIEKGAETRVRKVALVLDQVLVTGTPVDTSRARSNWIASIGVPILTNTPPDVDGREGNRSAAISAANSRSLAQGLQAISAWTITIGQDIVISNGVPYINKLNEGSSAQARTGMVKPALAAAQAAFNSGSIL